GRPLGYGWTSAASVPAGYTSVQLYRCHIGLDYYMSKTSTCEISGGTLDATRVFVIQYTPTSTSNGVIDTTKSFTVSAPVKATNPGSFQTFVSASPAAGSADSAFYLQANGDTWRFCMNAQGPTDALPCVSGPKVDTSAYVTVSGVWDAV